jgi:hypothetical protein
MTSSIQYRNTLKYLSKNKAIPSGSLEVLEERLVITCEVRSQNTPRRKGSTLLRKEVRSNSVRKKAQQVYLQVLKEAPHAFLPFILVSSPNACQAFATHDFCQKHRTDERLGLIKENKKLFEDIAMQHNISQNSHYLEVIEILFPDTSLRLSGQPEKSILPFHFADLLEFLSRRQDGQAQLQMICPFEGSPLPYVDLGSAPGVKIKFEFSWEESAAFVKFIGDRNVLNNVF